VVDSSQDPWFTRLLAGIETELSTRDTSLMLASTELTGQYDPGIVFEWIRERRVDGLIIAKSQRRDRLLIRRAVDAQLPTVLVAPDEAFHQVQLVRCDNRGAGGRGANYLVQLGHTRIAFAGGPRHSIDSKHRLQGLRKGCRSIASALDPSCVFSCGSYEAAAGDAFAREFFEVPPT
jgi:DNA-binding LacI/PurR family transcriptional regulator